MENALDRADTMIKFKDFLILYFFLQWFIFPKNRLKWQVENPLIYIIKSWWYFNDEIIYWKGIKESELMEEKIWEKHRGF